MQFYQHTLPNGLQIVAELNPSVYSVAAGFFVRTGSRDETADVSGVSHFLEHMAFKGNDKYNADDVNRIFDEIGANYNASTGEEVTMYYAAVLPEYLDQALELLSILMQPSLTEDDFSMEKNVILEEIGMYDDHPSFTAYDHVMSTHFAGHPLGQSILGSKESIAALTVQQMRAYHTARYKAGNMTLAVAGNTDFELLLKLIEKHCSSIPAGTCDRPLPPLQARPGTKLVTRESSVQQHLMQMGVAPDARDELRFAAELLAVIVGDDTGSRLFWELVDPGYVEAADLGYNEYDGAGTWMTYLSCLPEELDENIERMHRVFDEVNRTAVSVEELEQAKNKVASRIVLRGERPMGRLSALGGNWVYRQEYQSVADDLKIVRGVTQDDIARLLKHFPIHLNTTVGVGPRKELSEQCCTL
jgi:predicted Zn-dependent peptidase